MKAGIKTVVAARDDSVSDISTGQSTPIKKGQVYDLRYSVAQYEPEDPNPSETCTIEERGAFRDIATISQAQADELIDIGTFVEINPVVV